MKNVSCIVLCMLILLSSMSYGATGSGCNHTQSFFTELQTKLGKIHRNIKCNVETCLKISCSGAPQPISVNTWNPHNLSFSFMFDGCDVNDFKLQLLLNISSTQFSGTNLPIMLNGTVFHPPARIGKPAADFSMSILVHHQFIAVNQFRIVSTTNVNLSSIQLFPLEVSGMITNLKCGNDTTNVTTSNITTLSPSSSLSTTSIINSTMGINMAATSTISTIMFSSSTVKIPPSMHQPAPTSSYFSTPKTTYSISTTSSISTTTMTSPTTINNKSEAHSKPAKIVLLVLAILILVVVLCIYIYFKQKRRLSDQPAYYNDIALNDPLRSELDGENETNEVDDDDDDELPLFA